MVNSHEPTTRLRIRTEPITYIHLRALPHPVCLSPQNKYSEFYVCHSLGFFPFKIAKLQEKKKE